MKSLVYGRGQKSWEQEQLSGANGGVSKDACEDITDPACSSRPRWHLPRFDQGALGHIIRKPSAILTNSWWLYQELHEQ